MDTNPGNRQNWERTLMSRIFSLLILFVSLASNVSPRPAYAEIIYKLIDGAAGDQSGHTLSGFIEFDSPCGTTCTAANVTDFSFSVSGVYNYDYSYSIPSDVIVVNGLGHLNVSATSIMLNSSSLGQLAIGDSVSRFPYVQWVGGTNHIYRSLNPDAVWVSFTNSQSSIIATAIPEPSVFNLVLLICLRWFIRFTR